MPLLLVPDSGSSRLEPQTAASGLSPDPCSAPDPADDDLVAFPDDDSHDFTPAPRAWKILIVDDDPDVHDATAFALRGVRIAERSLELLHANGVASARQRLAAHPDVAVALVDVVMETSDAGLRLARAIREDLGMRAIRIVMRSGQPGHVGERDVLACGSVDDYHQKSEMTRERLVQCLTREIGAYAHNA